MHLISNRQTHKYKLAQLLPKSKINKHLNITIFQRLLTIQQFLAQKPGSVNFHVPGGKGAEKRGLPEGDRQNRDCGTKPQFIQSVSSLE